MKYSRSGLQLTMQLTMLITAHSEHLSVIILERQQDSKQTCVLQLSQQHVSHPAAQSA